jgi:predicted nucleotidyltransferase component of viral defense system
VTTDGVASIHAKLLNYSRARGADHQYTLIRWANERVLYRIGSSRHREKLALKGATLFYRWAREGHRATRDLDFLAQGEPSEDRVRRVLTDVLAIDGGDYLTFDFDGLSIERLNADGADGGFGVAFEARLGTLRIPVRIDLSYGQDVTPALEDVELPAILDMPAPRVLAYPKETVVAEKLEAIVSLGMFNGRLKDYFDLWFLAQNFEFEGHVLAEAVTRTFLNRGTALPERIPPGLSDEFARDNGKLRDWTAFGSRTRAFGPGELALPAVVSRLQEFLWPVLQTAANRSHPGSWSPSTGWR